MKKNKWIAVLLTAVICAGLAGCGGTAESTSSSAVESVAESTESTGSTAETAAAGGTLRVGTDATFAPFEYEENGEYVGFDIDLMESMAAQMGYSDVEFVNTAFQGLIPGLTADKFDVIASAMYITDERKQSIDFTDPYFAGGLCIMVQKDNTDITGPDSLSGKSVAVQVGTKSDTYLDENYPDVEKVTVEQNSEMFLQLETGKVDAVVTGRPAALTYAKTSGNVMVLDENLTQEDYGWGVRKDDTELKDAMNAALAALKENGTYDELVSKWFE